MNDDTTSTVNKIAKIQGKSPRVENVLSIPEFRSTVASAEDGVDASQKIAQFITDKLHLPIHSVCTIPDLARELTPPQYPAITSGEKGSDAGKNMKFANLLVKSFRFGHIGKTLYVQHDLIFTPLLEKDFDLLLRLAALRNDLPEELQKSISSYKSSELYAWLLAHPAVKDLPEMPDKRYVAVQNGILDLRKKKLLQLHEFSYGRNLPILYNRINANYIRYDVEEWTSSNSYRYLNRLAHPDCREKCVNALLYLHGKICSNDRSGKNLYHLWGPSNNGKSVYAAYTQSIVGTGNFGNLSLKDMTMQFSMINLRHALVNISTDEDTDAWNSSIASLIKRITGHDTLQVDVKYERMQQFRPYCVLLCMGNAEPRYSKDLDAGAAISKRLFLIPTGPTVLEPDEDLLEKKLLPEKDLLFSVAINYFMNHSHPDKIVNVEEIIFPDISAKDLFACWQGDCVKITNDTEEHLVDELWTNYSEYVRNAPSGSRLKRRAFEMECSIRLSSCKSPSRLHNRSCYIGLQLRRKIYQPYNQDFGEW